MAYLKYLKSILKLAKEERTQSILPKSDGPLANFIASSAIEAVNSTIAT